MKKNCTTIQTAILSAIFLLQGIATGIFAQSEPVPFDEAHWELAEARQTEFLGRACLTGTAYLKNTTVENGVIEVDMAVTGQRSYPGILFRMAGAGDYERIYLRPHLPALFRNVVQYVSTFNDIDSWQLYSGLGTMGVSGPEDGSAFFPASPVVRTIPCFKPVKPAEVPFGIIPGWKISMVYRLSETAPTPAATQIFRALQGYMTMSPSR